IAGTLADRLSKRTILIVAQSVMMVCAFALAWLTWTGRVHYWHVFVLSLIVGVATAFDVPTRQALLIDLVGREDLMGAISLNTALFNVARVAGPALAGVVLAFYGPAVAFFLNGASFLAIIWALAVMKLPPRRQSPMDGPVLAGLKEDTAEGLRFIINTPVALFSVAALFLINMFALNFQVLMPVIAKDVLGREAGEYGMLFSALGAGALLSSAVVSYSSYRGPSVSSMLAGAFLTSAFTVGAGLTRSFHASMVIAALTGWWFVAFVANVNSLLQYNTPDHLRGRVMSVYSLVSLGATPAGSIYVGLVAGILGGQAGCVAAGAAGVLASVFLLLWANRRQFFR
ncbi:MAG: MFS transporter, partial [Bacillota bacterium]